MTLLTRTPARRTTTTATALAVPAAVADIDFDVDPEVTTQDADYAEYEATLHGTLDDLGCASSADVYFEWGEIGSELSNTSSPETLTSPGSFQADTGWLNEDTQYSYRAIAEASDGDVAYGMTHTFYVPGDDDDDGDDEFPEP